MAAAVTAAAAALVSRATASPGATGADGARPGGSQTGTATRPEVKTTGMVPSGNKFTQTLGVGTTEWMAPEVMTGRFGISHYGKAVDVYSFGMVMYEVGTLHVPFHDVATSVQVALLVAQGGRPTLHLEPKQLWAIQ